MRRAHFAGNGDAVLLVTVWAMARTSSRLKAMGLVAALRCRMRSRKAVFFEGFSMEGDLFADLPDAAAESAADRAGAGAGFCRADLAPGAGADF